MNRTSISWLNPPGGAPGFSWNPLAGCRHAGPGCENCWAERIAATRLDHRATYKGLTRDGRWTEEVRFLPERLDEPLRRRKPANVFVCDMADLFNEGVTNEQIAAVFGVMAATPRHRYYVLTKRAKRMREWFEWISQWDIWETIEQAATDAIVDAGDCTLDPRVRDRNGDPVEVDIPHGTGWPLQNVRIGISVCTQADADRDIPELLRCPAALRYLSMEPLLQSVTLGQPEVSDPPEENPTHPLPNPKEWDDWKYWAARDRGIGWVIVGCESGPKARPMEAEWAESLLKQCQAAHVPFFFKQAVYRGKLDHCPPMWGTTWRQFPKGTP